MAYKNTVAIVSATTAVGAVIAKSIAANHRLLLMDTDQSKLVLLQREIQSADKNAEVDILNCCKNASWEADIIAVADNGESLDELAAKMKEVTNCKTVLHFTSRENDIDKLQQFLPHAQVVTIILSQPFKGTGASSTAFIHGTDQEAIDTAKMMIEAMACNPKIRARA
jgi:8-hydroxy-5-deazaflavin:NADPH oxidoreductase